MNQNKTPNLLNNVDILVLCGGLGTRLRPVVSNRPKPMAEVGEKPFLALVVEELLRHGFRRIIFCTGYLGEQIEEYFKKSRYAKEAEFIFSKEETPLGTGGAVKLALLHVKSENFFVINGDTASHIDFARFYEEHAERQTLLSIAVVKRRYANGQGNITLARNNLIASFAEDREESLDGFANAGCYAMRRDIEKFFPNQSVFSLEVDVFPRLAHRSHGFVLDSKFLDIGTPERYASAEEFFT